MGATPEVNLAEERIEWAQGTRREALSPYASMQRVIYDPVITTDSIPIDTLIYDCHITEVLCFVDGTSTPSVTFNLKWASDITAGGTELILSGATVTTTTATSKAVDRAFIPKGGIIWADITAKSGTVYSLTLVLKYRIRT